MIKLENVSFSFENKPILHGFNMTAAEKGVTCIVGKSGIGKSTIVDLICSLKKPDSGKVTADGKLSVVFQEDRLLPWLSVLDNINCVSDEETAKLWLSKVGLSDSFELLPDELSGGMKRRAALARALAYSGDALILDEPFNGVDDETKSVLINIIKDQAKTRPVILITHDKDDIGELADKIVSLDD